MKKLALSLITVLLAPSAFASEGFFACISQSGDMISAGLSEEVNLANLRIQVAEKKASTALQAYDTSVSPTEFRLVAVDPKGQEELLTYTIDVKLSGAFFSGSLKVSVGEMTERQEKVVCAVQHGSR